ncbi:MAG: carboxypeptidase-like regulatory domain-containing protein [Planctomycetota bacterium]
MAEVAKRSRALFCRQHRVVHVPCGPRRFRTTGVWVDEGMVSVYPTARRRAWPLAAGVIAWCSGIAAKAAAAQAAPTMPPCQGTVVDADGAPVADAHVRIEIARTVSTLCRDHTLDVLRRWPLADIATDAHGNFSLPLKPAHRRLGTGLEPPLTLVVEAPGFQTWYEPLPFGLSGFSRTRATLRRLVDSDLYTVEIATPAPGALAWVRRVDAPPGLAEGRVLAVPTDGRLRIAAPQVPTPLVFDGWRCSRGLDFEVELWSPGRSTAMRLPARGRHVRLETTPTATRRLRVLADGQPARGLCGLFACPDGEQRWFPLADGEACDDPRLRLIALRAPGRATVLASGAPDDIDLPPLSAEHAEVRVRDHHDAAPSRVDAWLVPLRRWPITSADSGDARTLRFTGEGQSLVDRSALQQHALVVSAPGHRPVVLPPSSLGVVPDPIRLPTRDGEPEFLTVVDENGRPAPGVDVRPSPSMLGGVPLLTPLTTDGAGTCRLPADLLAAADLACVGETGYALHRRSASTRTDQLRQRVELAYTRQQLGSDVGLGWVEGGRNMPAGREALRLAGRILQAQVVTREGRPAPFLPVTIDSVAGGERRTRHGHTDSDGRVLAAYVGDVATLEVRGARLAQRASPGIPSPPLEATVDAQRPVVIRLPAGARVQRVSFWRQDGGVRHENLTLDAELLAIAWTDADEHCDVHLAEGPPATVTGADVATAGQAIPILARDDIVRRVHVHAFDPDQRPVRGVEVRPAFGNARILVFDQREAQGAEHDVFAARDGAAHTVQVFHPDYLPSAPTQIPATSAVGNGKDPAVVVALTPGARVRLHVRKALPRSRPLVITIDEGGRPCYHLTLLQPPPDADGAIVLTLPFALPAGHYACTLGDDRLTFSTTGDGPIDVEGPR